MVKYALIKFKKQIKSGRLIIISSSWEDILPTFKDNSFDGILFDSFEPYVGQLSDFYSETRRLLKKGSHFTYFSSEAKKFSKSHLRELKIAGFKKINYRLCRAKQPKYCLYWKQKTIISPIITK